MLRAPLLFLLLFTSLTSAQELILREVYDSATNTQIEVNSLFGLIPQHGYLPVRATIHNGTASERTWNFAFRGVADPHHSGGTVLTSSFSIAVPAGKGGEFDFIVPVPSCFQSHPYSNSPTLECAVTATGFAVAEGRMHTSGLSDEPQVLISAKLHVPNGSSLDSEASSHSSRHGSNSTFAAVFDAKALPENWRAFTGYDVLMITAEEWLSIAPGAKTAILAWNRMGGRIFLYATNADTDLAALQFGEEGSGRQKMRRSFGKVEVKNIESSLALDSAAVVKEVFALPAGIGALRNDYEGGWGLQSLFGEKAFHYGFFIVVLVAFGILVGPVNLFVFAKPGQRHRMFFTTPLISLCASLVLILLIILQDGFGGRGMRFVHMEVRPDAGENAAYLQQEQIARTGVLLSSQHLLSETGFVTGVPLATSPWTRLTTDSGRRGGRYTLQQERTGLLASGDWYQSRSEHGHVLTGVRPTRGRIELEPNIHPPQLVSTFDFPIETLVFQDSDGSYWRAENLAQGHPTPCASIGKPAYEAFLRKSLEPASSTRGKAIRQLAKRRDHYIAHTTAAPPLESLDSIDWVESRTIITGPLVAP